MNDVSTIPVRSRTVQIEQLDGELIVIDSARDVVVHANTTAALILQLCDGQRTVSDIVDILAVAYPDAEQDIRRDVPDTINSLIAQGILTTHKSA
jgi:hypothetical protein